MADPDLRIVLAQTSAALTSITRCLIALMRLLPNAEGMQASLNLLPILRDVSMY
jgi:hypothetical protein